MTEAWQGSRRRRAGWLAAAGLTVIIASGCSSASHSAQTPPLSVTPKPGAPATTTPATTPSGVAPVVAAAQVSTSLSAVQRDLAGIDAASSQADTDLNAAAAAQAQNDNG